MFIKTKFIKCLYILFYFFFAISFSYLFVNCFFRELSVYQKFNSLTYFCFGVVIFAIWIFIYRLIDNKFDSFSKKRKSFAFILTFFLFGSLLTFCAISLEVPFGWDFNVVYEQARSYYLTGNRLLLSSYPDYFQLFPNNIFLFLLELIFFKIGGVFKIQNLAAINVFFNAISIFLAVLFLVLYCYRKFGCKKAYFSLLLSFFFTPLYLYVPIFYTDTLTVAFAPFILFLSTFIDEKKNKTIFLLFFAMSILLFVGMKIKMTVIFILVGFIFYYFIKHKFKLLFSFCAIFLVSYLCLNSIYQSQVVNRQSFAFKVNDYGSIPITHWIMMGIEDKNADNSSRNSYGGYNENDYKLTQSYTSASESVSMHFNEIKRRLKLYGVVGYFDYLTKKAVNAWGDGSYFVQVALGMNHFNNNTSIQNFFIGNSNDIILYFEISVQMAFLFIICFSSWYCLKHRCTDTLIEHVAIFLLFIFLLFWENRSRYLYNYIPLFIIVITYYIDKFKMINKFMEK